MDMLRCDGEKGMAKLKNMRGAVKLVHACVCACASRLFFFAVGCGKHFFERLRKTRSVAGKSVPACTIGPAPEGKHPGLPLFFKALRAMTTSPKQCWINQLVEKHGHPVQQEALRCEPSYARFLCILSVAFLLLAFCNPLCACLSSCRFWDFTTWLLPRTCPPPPLPTPFPRPPHPQQGSSRGNAGP
jgi:hypothetical protein